MRRPLTAVQAENLRQREARRAAVLQERLRRIAAQKTVQRFDLAPPDLDTYADDDDYEVGDGS